MDPKEVLAMLKNKELQLDIGLVEACILGLVERVNQAEKVSGILTQLRETLSIKESDDLLLAVKSAFEKLSQVELLTVQLVDKQAILDKVRGGLIDKIVGHLEVLKPGQVDVVNRFKTRSLLMSLEDLSVELESVDGELRDHYHVPRITQLATADGLHTRDFSAYRIR